MHENTTCLQQLALSCITNATLLRKVKCSIIQALLFCKKIQLSCIKKPYSSVTESNVFVHTNATLLQNVQRSCIQNASKHVTFCEQHVVSCISTCLSATSVVFIHKTTLPVCNTVQFSCMKTQLYCRKVAFSCIQTHRFSANTSKGARADT